MKKERLDVLLVEKGMVNSREKARGVIMSGVVYVEEVKVDKPGTKISNTATIQIRGNTLAYVSRGGLKLEKAIKSFDVDIEDAICLDIGASTGGFTDCMLQNKAKKVYAIDVGYGQLAWSLRTDTRVVCMERTNIRYVTPNMIQDEADLASIDVAFISLTKVIPAVYELLKSSGKLVCLVKPQFEAGRENVGKKGVVRDKNIHNEVLTRIIEFCVNKMKLKVLGLTYSPIKGPEGNIEYLLYLTKDDKSKYLDDVEQIIKDVVDESTSLSK